MLQDRIEVHVVQGDPAVIELATRNDLPVRDPRIAVGATVGLHESARNVYGAAAHIMCFLQHAARLA